MYSEDDEEYLRSGSDPDEEDLTGALDGAWQSLKKKRGRKPKKKGGHNGKKRGRKPKTYEDDDDLCIICNGRVPCKPKKPRGHQIIPVVQTSVEMGMRKSQRIQHHTEQMISEAKQGVVMMRPEDSARMLRPQVRTYFLLKHLMKFPEDLLQEALLTKGNPNEWFELCIQCRKFVDGGIKLHNKIRILETQLKETEETIRNEVRESLKDKGTQRSLRNQVGRDFKTSVRLFMADIAVPVPGTYIIPEPELPGMESEPVVERVQTLNEIESAVKEEVLSDVEPEPEADYLLTHSTQDDNDADTMNVDAKLPEPAVVKDSFQDSLWSALIGDGAMPEPTEGRGNDDISLYKDDTLNTYRDKAKNTKVKRIGKWEKRPDPEWEPKGTVRVNTQAVVRTRRSRISGRLQRVEITGAPEEDNKQLLQSSETSESEEEEAKQKKKANKLRRIKKALKKWTPAKSRPKPPRNFPKNLPKLDRLLDNDRYLQVLDMSIVPYPFTDEGIAKIPKQTCATFASCEYGEWNTYGTDHECPVCHKCFRRNYYMIAHIQRVHYGIEKPWRCDKCPKRNSTVRRFQVHMELHDRADVQVCPFCFVAVSSQAIYNSHLIEHQRTNPVKECYVCKNTFSQFKDFVQHMMTEHDITSSKKNEPIGKPRICEICSSRFPNTRSLKYHQLTKHNVPDTDGYFPRCDQCDKPFKDLKVLTDHIQKYHEKSQTFFCDQCGQVFYLERDLKSHIIRYHETEIVKKDCPICGVLYHARKLRLHQKRCHPETIKMSNEEKQAYIEKCNQEKPHKCGLCDQSFAFSQPLYHHYRNNHKDITDKFKCDLCGKGFSRQSSVKRHYEDFHLIDVVHPCQYCDKTFKAKDSLRQHQRAYCAGLKKKTEAGSSLDNSAIKQTGATGSSEPPGHEVCFESNEFLVTASSKNSGASDNICLEPPATNTAKAFTPQRVCNPYQPAPSTTSSNSSNQLVVHAMLPAASGASVIQYTIPFNQDQEG